MVLPRTQFKLDLVKRAIWINSSPSTLFRNGNVQFKMNAEKASFVANASRLAAGNDNVCVRCSIFFLFRTYTIQNIFKCAQYIHVWWLVNMAFAAGTDFRFSFYCFELVWNWHRFLGVVRRRDEKNRQIVLAFLCFSSMHSHAHERIYR